jgi:hypothetical protein
MKVRENSTTIIFNKIPKPLTRLFRLMVVLREFIPMALTLSKHEYVYVGVFVVNDAKEVELYSQSIEDTVNKLRN